ncbi:alpha/beta hydrolase [Tenggerimyces flavus]|uniref:Alpha/beta hydrolase fold domain-containing protein n=1 Tax=Tenggerimyces flavus TaxID=1708749 RepID=A0ABV7YEL9_9ACTN|nr:alpha/beta hydrolase [Tenggerimyces flavus]MBM7786745.1 acetyl esterase/lipase [Tenggerimyces flavus]
MPGLPVWEGTLYLDLLLPRPANQAPAVVYLHGGGWRNGERSAGLHPWVGPLLAAHGFVVANVTYRLSGRAPFPAQLDDVRAAVRWLRANASTYGIDPDRIGAMGDSAGGQLALLLASTAEVQAVVARCAPTDFAAMPLDGEDEYLTPLFGGPRDATAELRRQASPLTHVHAGVPPTLLVHGELDETVPVEQVQRFADALRAHEVDVTFHLIEGVFHNLRDDVDLAWGNEPWEGLGVQALEFFRRTLSG